MLPPWTLEPTTPQLFSCQWYLTCPYLPSSVLTLELCSSHTHTHTHSLLHKTKERKIVMVQLSTLFFALAAAGSVTAAPAHLHKRIAQVISDSTKQWEAACVRHTIISWVSSGVLTYCNRIQLEEARNAIKSPSTLSIRFSLVQAHVISRTMPIS